MYDCFVRGGSLPCAGTLFPSDMKTLQGELWEDDMEFDLDSLLLEEREKVGESWLVRQGRFACRHSVSFRPAVTGICAASRPC
jgi:hypothetical protein